MMRINLLFGYCHSYASNRSNGAIALYQMPLLLRHNPSNTCRLDYSPTFFLLSYCISMKMHIFAMNCNRGYSNRGS